MREVDFIKKVATVKEWLFSFYTYIHYEKNNYSSCDDYCCNGTCRMYITKNDE